PAPTAAATATPGPTAVPGDPDASPANPEATATPDPSGIPGIAILVPGAGSGDGSGPAPDGGSGSPAGAPVSDSGAGGAQPGGAGSSGSASLGGGASLAATILRVAPVVVVTTGGVAMTMAFLVFGKRRRDEQPTASDEVLRQAAGTGTGFVPLSGYATQRPVATATVVPNAAAVASAVMAAAVVTPDAPAVDADVPRWRRPSLIEARRTDPLRSAATSSHLVFEGSVGDAVTGLERRRIRYRLVSLLNAPDEIQGQEIGVLDHGDEVVLLERRGTFCRVVCPNGSQGWLHKMVLGDVVIDPGAEPETWTSGDEGPAATGTFEDVLRAYKESRGQFG
ncbi:MAG: hypothetical protein WCK58_18665, partial [Chloroflexota bacterium]